VPGQDYYEASRRLILDGSDGVVFVIDSAPAMLDANVASFRDLVRNLEHYRLSVERLPVVFQYNKRDLDSPLALGCIEREVGFTPLKCFEAVANRGQGVRPTARAISRSVVERFNY
jgi:signal recognition particle receptor subunit beta